MLVMVVLTGTICAAEAPAPRCENGATAAQLLQCADAAYEACDLDQSRDWLLRARSRPSMSEEVVDEVERRLKDLVGNFARVNLSVAVGERIVRAQDPRRSDQQCVLEQARDQLERTGKYEGLLPVGDYLIAGVKLTVDGSKEDDRRVLVVSFAR